MQQRSLEVGNEVPDMNGTLYRIVSDRRIAGPGETPVGGTDFPPIIAMCLGINVIGNNFALGDDGEIVQFFADGKAAGFPFNWTPKADLNLVIPDIPPHDYDPDFFVEVGKEYRTREGMKAKVLNKTGEYRYYVEEERPNGGSHRYEVWITGKVGTNKFSRDILEPWLERNFWKYVFANPNNILDKSAWSEFMDNRPPRPWPTGKSLFHVHIREVRNATQKFKLFKEFN
jgi:hypothetical protein